MTAPAQWNICEDERPVLADLAQKREHPRLNRIVNPPADPKVERVSVAAFQSAV